MNWTDIAVLIIILISVIEGWRKGFILTVVNFLKWFVGFAVAFVFYKQAAAYILEDFWNPLPVISEKIQAFLYDALHLSPDQSVMLTTSEMNDFVDSLGLPNVYHENLSQLIPNIATSTNDFILSLADHISRVLFDAIGFIVILLISVAVITILGLIMNGISKLPVLNELNRGGGVLIGGIIGLATVYFIMAALTFLYPFSFASNIIDQVETSQIAIYFYKYNILTFLLKNFFDTGLLILNT